MNLSPHAVIIDWAGLKTAIDLQVIQAPFGAEASLRLYAFSGAEWLIATDTGQPALDIIEDPTTTLTPGQLDAAIKAKGGIDSFWSASMVLLNIQLAEHYAGAKVTTNPTQPVGSDASDWAALVAKLDALRVPGANGLPVGVVIDPTLGVPQLH